MTILPGLLLVLALGAPQSATSVASDELTQVRELYALASYEEALARLDAAAGRVSPERAAQYRALCLLGLSRVVDAERAIERLVMEHPEYALPEAEVSPRLYTMFQNTRQRLLPAAARARYTEAKTAFDRSDFERAARGFHDVQALLADPVFVAEVAGLRDLRILSEGFLALAEAEVTAAESPALAATPAPPAVTAAAPAASPTPAAPAPSPSPAGDAPDAATAVVAAPPADNTVYAEGDAGVSPPVDVRRRLPSWNPPPALARMEFRGVLQIVVDETGAVASAEMVTPVHPAYDDLLVSAAGNWEFHPAMRNGAPVPYRKTFEIVLNRR